MVRRGEKLIVQKSSYICVLDKLIHHFNQQTHNIISIHTQQQRHYILASYSRKVLLNLYIIFLFLMHQDLEKHSSTYEGLAQHQDKKKYAKLTSQIKELFIQKIVFENLSIKQASQLLRINYSSAKAIASTHKKMKAAKLKKSIGKRTSKICEYRCLDDDEYTPGISQVCSSIGGLLTSEISLPKRKLIRKQYSSISEPNSEKENPEIMQDC